MTAEFVPSDCGNLGFVYYIRNYYYQAKTKMKFLKGRMALFFFWRQTLTVVIF
jgi:hypothetical protein